MYMYTGTLIPVTALYICINVFYDEYMYVLVSFSRVVLLSPSNEAKWSMLQCNFHQRVYLLAAGADVGGAHTSL